MKKRAMMLCLLMGTMGMAMTANASEEKIIGVTLMNLQYEFFQDLKSGIEESLPEGYQIDFADPNNDLNTQITQVENFCASGVDAIILNAIDADGIVTALDTAEEAGIPVITVDMKPSSGAYITYIGSDNYLGGELAAKWSAKNILADKEEPKIALLTNSSSSAATLRLQGFKDAIAEAVPGAEIVAEETGATREEFMTTVENILTANPDLDMIFSYSASGGLGAYDAIEGAGKEEQVSVVGFDASDEEQTAIKDGGCYKASIMQFPDKLGEACVDAVEKTLNGEVMDPEIGVEVGVYTSEEIVYAADLEE